MTRIFLHGPLAHPALIEAALGKAPREIAPFTLAGHALAAGRHGDDLRLVSRPGDSVAGVVLTDLDPEATLRLRHALGVVQGRDVGDPQPIGDDGLGGWPDGMPHDGGTTVTPPAPSAQRIAVLALALAEARALIGQTTPAAIGARWQMLLVRAAARLRALQPAAAGRRHQPRPADLTIHAWRQPYANFFSAEEVDLEHRHFDGGRSGILNRAAFVSGDAVTVLPWDPIRDRVLVVEQIRIGPLLRGDANPWLIEAVAGRVDPFESPEDAARREAIEEAGVELRELLPIGGYYPSPGTLTEHLYSYIALCDLPDITSALGGLETEGEDIRTHVMAFEELMSLVQRPEGANAPLMLSAWWLAANRDRLRAQAKAREGLPQDLVLQGPQA